MFVNNKNVLIKNSMAVLALREVWESETSKIALGLPKINARKSGIPNI